MGNHTRAVHTLVQPHLDFSFKPNADGTYTASIAALKDPCGTDAMIPFLEYIKKNQGQLESLLNPLRTGGKLSMASDTSVALNATVGGETNLKGKLSGGTSDLDKATIGRADGSLGAGGKLSGNAGFSITFKLSPNFAALDPKIEANMQRALHDKTDQMCLDWANACSKTGATIKLSDGNTIKVSPKVIEEYIHSRQPKQWRGVPYTQSDAGPTETLASTSGLDAPNHPFHHMYNDTLNKLSAMPAQPGDRQTPETLAAALTLSAANAGFDPSKPIQIAAGKQENTLFAVQGDWTNPASKSAVIDTQHPKVPTPEDIAQKQTINSTEVPQISAIERSGPLRA
jgi:hypothetical protein